MLNYQRVYQTYIKLIVNPTENGALWIRSIVNPTYLLGSFASLRTSTPQDSGKVAGSFSKNGQLRDPWKFMESRAANWGAINGRIVHCHVQLHGDIAGGNGFEVASYFSFHQGLDPIAASGFSVSEWILKILSSTRALSESEELKSRNLQTFSKSHVRHVHLVAPWQRYRSFLQVSGSISWCSWISRPNMTQFRMTEKPLITMTHGHTAFKKQTQKPFESPFESKHFGTRRPGNVWAVPRCAQEELETSDLDALSPSIFSAFWHLHDASLQLSSQKTCCGAMCFFWCDEWQVANTSLLADESFVWISTYLKLF